MESPKYSKPLVSIGMPAYNGEKFIKRAIDSLLVQTYSNFELIVSDNASDDSTWEILNRYAAKDKRIRLYRQEYNIGALGNFRFVLSKASGKYLDLGGRRIIRSEEHTSELQSRLHLVCRL